MENFLLLFDELDDLVRMVGAVWRPVVGFLTAVALFVGTGFLFYSMPMAAEGIALVLVTLGVLDTFRERREARTSETPIASEVGTNA
jgi:hypothetical protein